MNLDKEDCIESITKVLQSTANWRRSLSNRFPEDLRNIRAAILLEKLAVDIAYMTDEQWLELKPHFGGWASEDWRNGLSLASRQVGFHNRAKHISFFIKALAENLSSVAA